MLSPLGHQFESSDSPPLGGIDKESMNSATDKRKILDKLILFWLIEVIAVRSEINLQDFGSEELD
jgi:hypothetical protein